MSEHVLQAKILPEAHADTMEATKNVLQELI